MKAKSKSNSRAFAARSGTCSSSIPLASPGAPPRSGLPAPRRPSRAFARGVDPPHEPGDGLAEGQLVAALYPLAIYGSAVEEGPVGGAEDLHDETVVGPREPRVLPRDVRVRDDDVALLGAADGPRPAPLQRVGLVVQDDLHDLAREAVAFGLVCGDGGGALIPRPAGLLGAEDAGLPRRVLRGAFLAGALAAGQLGGDAELPEA